MKRQRLAAPPESLDQIIERVVKGAWDRNSVTPDARTAAVEALQHILGTPTSEPTLLPAADRSMAFARPGEPVAPRINRKGDQAGMVKYGGLEEDPFGEMAVQLAQQAHPNAMKRVTDITLGTPAADRMLHGPNAGIITPGGHVSIGKQSSTMSSYSTLLHELSHALGLPDIYGDTYRTPSGPVQSAQDISRLVNVLNRDVELPTPKRRRVE